MTNYTTNTDLIEDVLFRLGEPTDSSSDYYGSAIKYLNRSYQAIWRGGGELLPEVHETWYWMRSTFNGSITLLPEFATGSVNVSNGSTAIAFSDVPTRSGNNISLSGWFLKVDEHTDAFRITSHAAGNLNATIESVYTGEDNATASFKTFVVDYELGTSVLRLSGAMRVSGGEVVQVTPEALRRMFPIEDVCLGTPTHFALLGWDTTGSKQIVRFSHYAGDSDTDLMKIDYDYVQELTDISAGATECALPREYRKMLCDWACYFLALDKEDSRAQNFLNLAVAGLRGMVAQNQAMLGQNCRSSAGRIYPRGNRYGNDKRIMRTDGGFIVGIR